jgi:lipopolysaccharide transport system permease protein
VSPASEALREERTAPSAHAETVANGSSSELPLTVIESTSGWRAINWRDLWRHRELLMFLTWRDIKVRYKQTVLGIAWAVLQPFFATAAVGLFLGQILGSHADQYDQIPFGLYIFSGMLPWILLSSTMNSVAHSVVHSNDLVTKVYFPRLILPLAAVGDRLVDFIIGFILLLCVAPLVFGKQYMPGPHLALVPVLVVGLVVTALGVGLVLAALAVAYRDVFHILPHMTQFWFFATPAIFYTAKVEMFADIKDWLPLNPAYGLIINFRAAVLDKPPDWQGLLVSLAVGFVLLVVGVAYFQRAERQFPDII